MARRGSLHPAHRRGIITAGKKESTILIAALRHQARLRRLQHQRRPQPVRLPRRQPLQRQRLKRTFVSGFQQFVEPRAVKPVDFNGVSLYSDSL